MSSDTHLFLSVMGTMGSGKTTATALLSDHFGWSLLAENFGENAFLPRFYENPDRWAFHSQTFFLMEKIAQIMPVEALLAEGSVIQDVPIYQDVFGYAKTLHTLGSMEESEWKLYHKIFTSFEATGKRPDAIIYLRTSLPVVEQRIKGRGRSYEQAIPHTYLAALQRNNEAWLASAHGIPVITIETDSLNIVKSARARREFLAQVSRGLESLSS